MNVEVKQSRQPNYQILNSTIQFYVCIINIKYVKENFQIKNDRKRMIRPIYDQMNTPYKIYNKAFKYTFSDVFQTQTSKQP